MPSIYQRVLSIFGLDREKKRVDIEWEEAFARMRDSTDQIRDERQHITLLQDTQTRLIDSHNHIRHLIHESLESVDGPGKAENS
jgi:hypothetical protein